MAQPFFVFPAPAHSALLAKLTATRHTRSPQRALASPPGGDDYWTLDACDDFGQRWLVHHDDLLKAVVLLGEMLGVEWEDG